jgi:Ca2+/Na+ antiporter
MGRAAIIMSGKRNDDGITDRLNYRYTVVILVAFAIINMNRLYTDQIKCWVKSLCLIRYIYMISFSFK